MIDAYTWRYMYAVRAALEHDYSSRIAGETVRSSTVLRGQVTAQNCDILSGYGDGPHMLPWYMTSSGSSSLRQSRPWRASHDGVHTHVQKAKVLHEGLLPSQVRI